MTFKKVYIIPAFLLLTIGMAVGVEIDSFVGPSGVDQWEKLQQAFSIVSRRYVDDVETDRIVEHAITGMLEELDPHSAYISASEIEELQEEYRGSFGGIGIWFEVPDDTARVVSTITDGPSEKAGLMAGDRIIRIEDSSAVGLSDRQLQNRLKGPIGTKVNMTVRRPGIREPIDFEITRGRIPLYTVDGAYMIDDKTGYIRVSRFAMTTYDEFLDALEELQAQGMQQLMLDLRFNPGGVMDAAVEMVDEMLSGGKTIVYTRSRHSSLETLYESTADGIFEDQPVIVLVNPYSASASEIVAGALQDHDRALIVGQRTFGKGLVQQQFALEDGSVLQLTVSRYYTPAGRLIQTPYDDGDQLSYYENKFQTLEDATYHPGDYLESIPDSLKFETLHGRTVFGGGGILPDYVVAPDTSSFAAVVSANGLDDLFIRDWFEKNEQQLRAHWGEDAEKFVQEFQIDETQWQGFKTYLESNDFSLSLNAESADAQALAFTPDEVEADRETIETRMKFFIARRLHGFESALPIFNEIDPVILEAQKLWDRAEELTQLSEATNR